MNYGHLTDRQLADQFATLCDSINATPRSAMRRGMASSARDMHAEIERRARVAEAEAEWLA